MASPCPPVIRMLRSGRRRRPSTDDDGAVGGTNDTHGSEGSPRTAPGPGAGYVQDGQYHSASPVPAGTQTEPRSRSSYSSLQLLPPRATMAPAYQSAPQVPVRVKPGLKWVAATVREERGIWQLSPRAYYEAPPYVLPAVPEAHHTVSDRVSDWVEGSIRAHAASSDGDARTHSTFRVNRHGTAMR